MLSVTLYSCLFSAIYLFDLYAHAVLCSRQVPVISQIVFKNTFKMAHRISWGSSSTAVQPLWLELSQQSHTLPLTGGGSWEAGKYELELPTHPRKKTKKDMCVLMYTIILTVGEQWCRNTQLDQQEWQIEELMCTHYSLSSAHCLPNALKSCYSYPTFGYLNGKTEVWGD